MPRIISISRPRDEEVLAWIRARASGLSGAQVAAKYDAPRAGLIRATNAVREADRAESGEEISGAYW